MAPRTTVVTLLALSVCFGGRSAAALKTTASLTATDYCVGKYCRQPGDLVWYIQGAAGDATGTMICALAKKYEKMTTDPNCFGDSELVHGLANAGKSDDDLRWITNAVHKRRLTALFSGGAYPHKYFQVAAQLGGHVPFDDHRMLFFTMTRDPMDRMLSQYYQDNNGTAPARGAFAKYVLSQSDNLMTRWLLPNGFKRQNITQEDFDEAMQYLKGFLLVLPMEYAERAVPIMRDRLGWKRMTKLLHSDSIRSSNTVAELEEAEYQQLMEHTKWDLQGYQKIKEQFQKEYGVNDESEDTTRVAKGSWAPRSVNPRGRTICGFSNNQLRCPGLGVSID